MALSYILNDAQSSLIQCDRGSFEVDASGQLIGATDDDIVELSRFGIVTIINETAAEVFSLNVGMISSGTTQADAMPMTTKFSVMATVPTNSGVILLGNPGEERAIIHRGANALKIYPPVGGQIDALGTNAPASMLPTETAWFACAGALQWYSV